MKKKITCNNKQFDIIDEMSKNEQNQINGGNGIQADDDLSVTVTISIGVGAQ